MFDYTYTFPCTGNLVIDELHKSKFSLKSLT